MTGFYYFLPGVTKAALVGDDGNLRRDILANFGLDEVLRDVSLPIHHAALCELHKVLGPWENTGVMLSIVMKHSGSPRLVQLDLAQQDWRRRGNSNAWMGIMRGDVPTPLDLERTRVIPGYTIKDHAGWEWRIPVARQPDSPYGTLPQSYVFDDAGEAVGKLEAEYAWIWDLSGEIHDWYKSEGGTFAWLAKQTARVLSVNYRIGGPEITWLNELGHEILRQETMHAIAQATYGFQLIEDAKKNEDGNNLAASS